MKMLGFPQYALGVCASAALLAGCGGSLPAAGTPGAGGVPAWKVQGLGHAACPQVVGAPTCLVLIVDKGVNPACVGSTCGIAPKELQRRYNLPSFTKGKGQVVALVDAFDDPTAEADLATYRTEFGLGVAKFKKYNEHGDQSDYPENCATASSGWCVEEALDIEMVSASCPKCAIDLIESDGSISGMETAETAAAKVGATIVSNSWVCYGSIDCGDPNFPKYFRTKGVQHLAASGDAGYAEIGAPGALESVVSVGGTQIGGSGSNYTEVPWGGSGGGCATGVTKPLWQRDPDCKYRTDNDISAQAGLSPGVAEYSSQEGGWFGVGGTSVASPLVAGVYGLAGNAKTQDAGKELWTLTKSQLKKDIHFIADGSGSGGCGNYLCGDGKYRVYYSGPTGWGTPNGIGAF